MVFSPSKYQKLFVCKELLFPQSFMLLGNQLPNSLPGQRKKLVKIGFFKRVSFGRSLNFNNFAAFGQHKIHIRLRIGIFDIINIGHFAAFVNGAGNRCNMLFYRIFLNFFIAKSLSIASDKATNPR